MRLRGRFENAFGAHAGFEAKELLGLLGTCFESMELLTAEYFRLKYSGRLPRILLDFLLSPSVINYSAAAHYVLCQRMVVETNECVDDGNVHATVPDF